MLDTGLMRSGGRGGEAIQEGEACNGGNKKQNVPNAVLIPTLTASSLLVTPSTRPRLSSSRQKKCTHCFQSYLNPILNYTLDACESGSDICPEAGDELHCPCATGGSIQKCSTLECSNPGGDPGGTCGEFVFSTVRGNSDNKYALYSPHGRHRIAL